MILILVAYTRVGWFARCLSRNTVLLESLLEYVGIYGLHDPNPRVNHHQVADASTLPAKGPATGSVWGNDKVQPQICQRYSFFVFFQLRLLKMKPRTKNLHS